MSGQKAEARVSDTELRLNNISPERVRRWFLQNHGSPFQQRVWAQLCSVPFGDTDNYQSVAIGIGKPSAVRTVAAANGANRVAIVIPCHRIIGKDGSMTGYGGGIARKAWLIAHEEKHRLPG